MFKKGKLLIAFATMLCIILQMFVFTVSAANKVSIAISDTKPLVGSTITVTFNFTTDKAIGSVDSQGNIKYDSSILECTSNPSGTSVNNGSINISWYDAENKSTTKAFSFKFKVKKAGSANVTVSNVEIASADLAIVASVSASYNIAAIDKSSLPKDANLKGIKLSAGSLSPAFSASTTSYTVKVPYSTTKVVVTPTLSDSKAKWSVSGSSSLKVGTNTRVITVTAQNGSTKKYTIKITREADTSSPSSSDSTSSEDTEPKVNPYEISVGGEMWLLLNDYSLITIPAGFTQSNQVINGIEMPVLVDKKNGRTVVYATNEADTVGAYFIYTGEDNEYTEYKFFVTDDNTYVIIEPEKAAKAPVGFVYKDTEVMGYEVGVYKYTDSAYSDYVIFYAEAPSGEKNYYRYDSSEATVQKATDFIVALSKMTGTVGQDGKNIIDKFLKLDDQTKIIVCSVLALVLLIIVLIIINIVKLASSGKKQRKNEVLLDMDDYGQELDFETIIDGKDPKTHKVNGVIIPDEEQ